MGHGSTNVTMLLTAGGALAFTAAMGVSRKISLVISASMLIVISYLSLQGWYLFVAMVLDSVGFPYTLPNPDLSSRVFSAKTKDMSAA
jgi:hypothetical protein